MLLEDVKTVYYIEDGCVFNVVHSEDNIRNYEFPKRVVANKDIKIYKQCLDGHIQEISSSINEGSNIIMCP